ncbi:MAG: hypothetical protein NT056_11375, partial [Proteobacteria bacterium]|nr:hypothetical protein [Pseudomonadota bacterium]
MTAFFQVSKQQIPRVLLGTSPFLGAGQFGSRAPEYFERFHEHPENMVQLILHAWKIGVRGIQAIAFPRIIEAIETARKQEGIDPMVVGTLVPNEVESGIELMKRIDARVGLLHGMETDHFDVDMLSRHLELIQKAGMIPGLASHRVFPTLRKLIESKLDYHVLMLPLNPRGIMIGDVDSLLDELKKVKCPVIAKKALGAGKIPPFEALPWLAGQKVAGVALGVASEA